ncbi:hypothetical protein D3OALGA1CA_2374 [Olavius algarvensis associated proteobacterium Delta 3]|nr:hypothetical protein D3OALGA1CA_2374 [Olavius algarvensis associated proteobacterium Delta 3]
MGPPGVIDFWRQTSGWTLLKLKKKHPKKDKNEWITVLTVMG